MNEDSGPEIARLFAARSWAVLLQGIIAITFGVLAFAWPGVTVATLVLLFGSLRVGGRRLLSANSPGMQNQGCERHQRLWYRSELPEAPCHTCSALAPWAAFSSRLIIDAHGRNDVRQTGCRPD